jgi:hypothetical protein
MGTDAYLFGLAKTTHLVQTNLYPASDFFIDGYSTERSSGIHDAHDLKASAGGRRNAVFQILWFLVWLAY